MNYIISFGVKIHDVKDPAEALGPMFKQVVSTLFELMEENEQVWKKIKNSKAIPIIGPDLKIEPKPFDINVKKLIDDFKIGYTNWMEIWQKIIGPENWNTIEKLFDTDDNIFLMDTQTWAKILYDLVAAFHHWKGNRQLMISLMTPLYFAIVASFVNRTIDMSNSEAVKIVEEQAEIFENTKNYLIKHWDEKIDYYH